MPKTFLQKPWENERLLSILRTQIALRDALRGKERLEAENSALRSSQAPSAGFVAKSSAMRQVREMIEQVAPSDANVHDYRGEWHRERGGGSNAAPDLSAFVPSH